jgi:cytochrome c oxidase subunit 2
MGSAASTASHFSPFAATDVAHQWDTLYGFLLIASAISCVLVIGGLIVFAMKYRRTSEDQKTPYISHNTTLEFLWSFIPFVIFMIVFVWGWVLYYNMRKMPEHALEIAVEGQQWSWTFAYKNGRRSMSELYVPVGEPVKLVMASHDVLHSFYVPAFRIKQDVVPGRYTTLWFNVNTPGTYQIFCAEYCGDQHSGMLGKVHAVPRAQFDEWLANDPYKGMAPVEIGKTIYEKTCFTCHKLDSDRVFKPGVIGPGWKGLFGVEENIEGGGKVAVDENYIRESLMNPNAKIVQGFPSPSAMPTFAGQLSEQQIMGVIEFIKSLK